LAFLMTAILGWRFGGLSPPPKPLIPAAYAQNAFVDRALTAPSGSLQHPQFIAVINVKKEIENVKNAFFYPQNKKKFVNVIKNVTVFLLAFDVRALNH